MSEHQGRTWESQQASERILCNVCMQSTWHIRLCRHVIVLPLFSNDDEVVHDIQQEWELFQCLGCDHVTVRVRTDYPWEHQPEFDLYPERRVRQRRPRQYQRIPPKLAVLYSQVVAAFNSGSMLLCAGGLRALLEGVCGDKGITEGPDAQGKLRSTLEGRINGLVGIVPPSIVRNLHGLRFLGNRALHELDEPEKADLELALGVVEDILNVVYDLDYRSELVFRKASHPKPVPGPERCGPV